MNKVAPMRAWTGVLVFSVPALCLTTTFGIGLASFLFVLAALFMWRDGRAALARHWHAVRWVVLAFLFHVGYVLLCFALRPEQQLSSVEKPLRMFCAASALMVVLVARPPRRALWWGVIAGTLGALVLVGYQRLVLGLDRPGGLTNPITFGDIALCLGLVALAAAPDFRDKPRQAWWPALGALAGLLACVMTGTRGAWVALPLAALLFVRHGGLLRNAHVRALLLAGFACIAVLVFVPASGIQARVGQGIDDVRTWYGGGNKFTNMGVRLELWKGAGMLVSEQPLFGMDRSAVQAQLGRYVAQGRLDPVVLGPQHLHNDALQALVTGGIPGLLAWFGILAAPFAFFAREAASAGGLRRGYVPALAGMLVPLSYFGFGLTEMMFWSVRACLFYALMVFMLMGFCLNAKE